MNKVKQFAQYTDTEIISRILSGELALYEIIMRRYNPYLFKIGRGYGFNQHDTEDLMQETYLSAYNNLAKFEQRSTFKTWLVKIMLNHCYHKKQKSSTKKEFPSDTAYSENAKPMFSHAQDDPAKSVINKELGHAMEKALQQISEPYRVVFLLRELNELSTRETSEALGISESNVKVRLNRARSELRNVLETTYSPDDIFEFNLIYCNRVVENVLSKLNENTDSPLHASSNATHYEAAKEAFSRQAAVFDEHERSNPSAKWSREVVRQHLMKHLQSGSRILELNAGTGQDAEFLALQGMEVLATDQSDEMIRQATHKAKRAGKEALFKTSACALNDIHELASYGPFDHVFSNFGGLNCIADPKQVAGKLSELLTPDGQVTVVMLAPVCPWELLSLFTGKWDKAFRRLRKSPVTANIENVDFPVWYFSASQTIRMFSPWFRPSEIRSLAIFTPPPYKPGFGTKHPVLFSLLNKLDHAVSALPLLNRIGDYYMITFEKKRNDER